MNSTARKPWLFYLSLKISFCIIGFFHAVSLSLFCCCWHSSAGDELSPLFASHGRLATLLPVFSPAASPVFRALWAGSVTLHGGGEISVRGFHRPVGCRGDARRNTMATSIAGVLGPVCGGMLSEGLSFWLSSLLAARPSPTCWMPHGAHLATRLTSKAINTDHFILGRNWSAYNGQFTITCLSASFGSPNLLCLVSFFFLSFSFFLFFFFFVFCFFVFWSVPFLYFSLIWFYVCVGIVFSGLA